MNSVLVCVMCCAHMYGQMYLFNTTDGRRHFNGILFPVFFPTVAQTGGQQEQNSHHPGTDGKSVTNPYQHGKKNRRK